MHPTKLKVLRVVEAAGEMDCNEIAGRIGLCGKQARLLTRALVAQGYLTERQVRRTGVRGPSRRIVTRSDLAVPGDVDVDSQTAARDLADDPLWWPGADLVVERAMRGMVRVGRAAA